MWQMRAQPLVIVIRQEREKPIRPSIGHALWFSGSIASGKSFGALVVRLGLPNRRAVIFPGAGPCGVYSSEDYHASWHRWNRGRGGGSARLVPEGRKVDP